MGRLTFLTPLSMKVARFYENVQRFQAPSMAVSRDAGGRRKVSKS